MARRSGSVDLHLAGAHSRASLAGGRRLDWSREPARFKRYPDARRVGLAGSRKTGAGFFELVCNRRTAESAAAGAAELATLLRLGYGATASYPTRSGPHILRSAPSAGALYPCELYLCCGAEAGLQAGVYNFNSGEDGLYLVNEGDFRASIASALASGGGAEAYLVITTLPWRCAWKYGQRAYRYCKMDSGHLAANPLLLARALGIGAKALAGFDDGAIGSVLGVDAGEEFVELVLPLGSERLDLPPSPPSRPAACEPTPGLPELMDEIRALKRAENRTTGIRIPGVEPLQPSAALALPEVSGPGPALEPLLTGRRSYREPAARSASLEQLSAFLRASAWSYAAEWVDDAWPADLVPDLHVFVLEVDGAQRGIYRFDAPGRALIPTGLPLTGGALASACLGQRFVEQANAVLAITVDFERLGAAGQYGLACVDAGLVGQMAYLGSEALGAGCCGIGAFFDDELGDLLGLDRSVSGALYALTFALK